MLGKHLALASMDYMDEELEEFDKKQKDEQLELKEKNRKIPGRRLSKFKDKIESKENKTEKNEKKETEIKAEKSEKSKKSKSKSKKEKEKEQITITLNKEKVLKIGVIQLVEHSALDANYKGFVDGLAEAGYVDGKNIKIDYQNAQGEQANCVTIAQKLINDHDDLIFAIATPAAQAVANLTQDIPVLISSVTDPESAKLVASNAAPGNNVTGTSDLTPCAAQIKLLKKIVPNAKTVGMLFCSSEQNSYFQHLKNASRI